MSKHPDQIDMGPKRSYRVPAPSKIRFTEHNGRTVCANPSGVPAKWLPVYLELASRMYDGGPSFAIGKDEQEIGNPVTLRLKDECGSWSTYGDPADAARSLEMVAPTVAPKPTKKDTAMPRKPKVTWTPNSPAVQAASDARVDFMTSQATALAPASQATAQLPSWAEEWLAGLVFDTKRDYARRFLAHLLCDAPAPECPGTEWAEKARKRARRLAELAA